MTKAYENGLREAAAVAEAYGTSTEQDMVEAMCLLESRAWEIARLAAENAELRRNEEHHAEIVEKRERALIDLLRLVAPWAPIYGGLRDTVNAVLAAADEGEAKR